MDYQNYNDISKIYVEPESTKCVDIHSVRGARKNMSRFIKFYYNC